jgi:hypothetical protein
VAESQSHRPSGNAVHTIEFLGAYKERFQPRYGFLRPIIAEV